MMNWQITVAEAPFPERTFKLQEGVLLLGSSRECEIRSESGGVAPRHVEFLGCEGKLQLRCLDGAPGTLLNGLPVHGLVEVPCPASLEIGPLRILIKEAASPEPAQLNSDMTGRLVHLEHPGALKPRAPDNLDVTGRIVHRLPEADDDASRPFVPADDLGSPALADASSSLENTMAFSMDALDFAMDDKVPVRTDYSLKAEIARGGMGKIYSAEDPLLKRVVALKVSTIGDRTQDAKFSVEAEVLAALEHPNIVPIHHLGVDAKGRPFYSMKLIQGRTLQWIIRQLAAGDRETEAAYTRQRLLGVFRKVCDAVAFAHDKGYLHRDLKPENIMVGAFGEVLVMDWGLAKPIRKPNPAGDVPNEAEPDTLPYIEGSPQYMSPEQANGVYGGLDERSDIYSLGGILYAILTLRPPVSGRSVAEVLENVRKGEVTTTVLPRGSVSVGGAPVRMERALPEALRAVTLKALSLERDQRYQSVSAFVADVESYQNGFATSAEEASVFRQVALLVKRHRLASGLLFLLLCGTALFTMRLAASEKSAHANAQRAERASHIAAEQRLIAEDKEQQAVLEKQTARRSAAKAHMTLAENAEQRFNGEEMEEALNSVEPEFHTQEWNYLSKALNSCQRTFEAKEGFVWTDCVPHPKRPGVLITLQSDQWLRTLDLNTGETEDLFKLDGIVSNMSLAVSPDASRIAVMELLYSNRDGKPDSDQIAVWTLPTGEKKTLSKTPFCGWGLLMFSPDGRQVMKVYQNQRQKNAGPSMFDTETGAMLWQLPGETVYDTEFIPNSGLVYHASSTESVELNPQTGLRTSLPPLTLQGFVGDTSIAVRALNLFKIRGPKLQHYAAGKAHFEVTLPGSINWRSNLMVSRKDQYLAALCEAGDNSAVLQVRRLEDGGIVQTVPIVINSRDVSAWRLSGHPETGQYAVFRGRTMKVWNISRFVEKATLETFPYPNGSTGFAFLNSSNEILQISRPKIASDDPQAFTLNVCQIKDSGIEVKQRVDDLIFSKNSQSNFSASGNGRVIATLAMKGEEALLRTYRFGVDGAVAVHSASHPDRYKSIKISPDGEKIITFSGIRDTLSGNTLQKHDRTGIGMLSYEDHFRWCWLDNIHAVEIALARDPASGDSNTERSLVLWSSERPTPLISVPASSSTALAASPDSSWIAEGGKDGKIRLRDPKTLEAKQTLRVHDGPVNDLAWHPTLPFLATAAEDSRVRIWNMETGQLVEEFGFFSLRPQRLDWSPDGHQLAVLHAAARCFLRPASCQAQGK